ncbi:MAG: MerR family transcriptional regulator [Acidimicrobiia bacterium]|nr:MerR family transcriptional regulator [Acidimicrobiia bacterium]
MPDQLPGFENTDELHSIGEVINLLKGEFPDLTVSKVRFLEGRGLITPERSSAGYRMFSDDDVRRLQYVLREQRDHFLPLKVIKSKLTAWERGEEAPVTPESGPPPETYFASSGVSMNAQELGRSSGLSASQIDALVGGGILEPMELPDGRQVFRDDDLTIARAAHRLLAQGLEVRHLRTIRLSAERETDLLAQLVAPLLRHRNPDNRRGAAVILADGAQAGSQLQEGIVRSKLRRLLEG